MLSPSTAWAQVAPAAPGRAMEVAIGGTWSAPVGLGSLAGEFFSSSGGSFSQFEAENRFGQGFGVDVRIGVPVGQRERFWIEGIGALARTSLQTRITNDVETNDDVTVSEHALRYGVGGAARLVLGGGAASEWFLRGGAGWLREVAAGSALVENGISSEIGVGWTYTLRSRAGRRRLGLRLDGRLEMRSGGVTFGEDKLRFGPVVGGALTMGFR
jgi:hypothetical protein